MKASMRFYRGFVFLFLLFFTPLLLRAQTNDVNWSVGVLDRILATVPPGQRLAQVGDMQILVSKLKAWRNQLAGAPSQDSTFDGSAPTWTSGNVYYEFTTSGSNAVSAAHQKAFLDGAAEWAMFANLHFFPHTSEPNYVTILENTNLEGGQSAVGMVGGQQFLQIGPEAWNRDTITHELGHTLGLVHEQQRTNRDLFVTILSNNIIPGQEPNFVLLPDSQSQGPYDFLSVMHYARNALSISNTLDTIEPLPAYSQYLNIMGQGDPVLTPSDRAGMAAVYGAGPVLSSVVTNTQDSGPGSLRAALYYAYDHPRTTITFNIATNDPGFANGVFTIQLTDQLPSLWNATVIDGSTEPVHINPTGPAIQLNGALAPPPSVFPNGLHIHGTNCAVRSLVINGFAASAILIDGTNAIGNSVSGCYLGIDPSGTSVVSNGLPQIVIAAGASRNTIGGITAASRNVISGSAYQGMVIEDPGTMSNVVEGNYIGLNAAGTAALPNAWAGLEIVGGAQSNIIGGLVPGARNVISGNSKQGIAVDGTNSSGNVIEGNYIGLDSAGSNAIPNAWAGVNFFGATQGNLVGGTAAGAANFISGNSLQGVLLQDPGTDNNLVLGNDIGINVSAVAVPNGGAGVAIVGGAQANTVGGTSPSMRNVISGNTLQGVAIGNPNANGNIVQGNYIGVDPSGSNAIPNGWAGVNCYGGAQGNLVGGTTSGAGNLISGNGLQGIIFQDSGTDDNLAQGNYIGLNVTGNAAVPNGAAGVAIVDGAQSNIVGGTLPSMRNVICGNVNQGVAIGNTSANVVQGNYIGVDPSGNTAIPNAWAGVDMFGGAQGNLIGGTAAGARNVISGNASQGVVIGQAGTESNFIQGNYIGLNAAGTAGVPNTWSGVEMYNGAQFNLIGGGPGARNIISGNGNYGVYIHNTNCAGNLVQGNTIGLNAAGNAQPNTWAGVAMFDNTQSNQIGGTAIGNANLIVDNLLDGVQLFDATTTDNSVRGNSIYGNGGVGIGVYSGANNSQTTPMLTSAVLATNTVVSGSLTSAASTVFHLDFYANPSPQTQAQTYLGARDVTTGSGGTVSFSANLGAIVPKGQIITATATDPSGNTSPLSGGITVTAVDSVGDGIPDAWRTAHFGGSGTTTNNQSAAGADPDHDGLANWQEFLAGTDPNNASSTLRAGKLNLSGTNATVNFSSVQGIVYRVEDRDDLVTGFWSILADQVIGTGGTIQIVDPAAGTALPRRFYRVEVLP